MALRGICIAALLLAAFGNLAFVGPAETPQPKSLRASRGYGKFEAADVAEEVETSSPLRFGGAFLSVLAAIALAILPLEAQAARSGGRMGGSAPAARRAPPPRAPTSSSATTVNKTVINKTTVVAPPPVMGGGYGMGMGMGVVVAPPPTIGDVIVGSVVGGAINNAMYGGHNHGYSSTDRMLENQQRQDERQLDNQSRELEQLRSELQQLKASKN
mmetsp:Transcript_79494/g.140307  ORF Transcript_79494/g.140307 Transcript_79494/m.140307 type:complete len:215 (+) Transcript_79494:72-716(+)